MRLIDGEQRDLRAFQQGQEACRQQTFGCDVEQVEFAIEQLPLDLRGLAGIEAGVEEGRTHAELAQRIDLVLHQRDQRRDHDAGAVAQQRRQLIAQRFAAAGRHQHQRIAAGDHLLDDLPLFAAEAVVAEDLAELFEGSGNHAARVASGAGDGIGNSARNKVGADPVRDRSCCKKRSRTGAAPASGAG